VEISKTIDNLKSTADKLAASLDHTNGSHSTYKHAKYMRDTVIPLMATLREHGDTLELSVPSSYWPLPTYREMLFIK
jgi:glutamine synthetase